jgi:hypothetical protein
MITPVIVGVYPGSFDPLTIAHLAIAEVALDHLGLDRLELAISHGALGKEHLLDDSIAARTAAIERAAETRPWLGVVVVHTRLIAEIAAGYDAVVMGADKWAQVNDPAWYGGDVRLRDRAVAALPRVGIAPRGDWPVPDRLRLPVPDHLAEVSATAVRDGRDEWAAPEARNSWGEGSRAED